MLTTPSTPDNRRRGPPASVIRNSEPERRSGNIFSRIRTSVTAAVGIAVAAGGIYYMSHEKPIEETTEKQPVAAAQAQKSPEPPQLPKIETGKGASLQIEAGRGASISPLAKAPQQKPASSSSPPVARAEPQPTPIPRPSIAITPPAPAVLPPPVAAPAPVIAQKAPGPKPAPPPAQPVPPPVAPPPPPAIAKVIPSPARQPVRSAPAPRPIPPPQTPPPQPVRHAERPRPPASPLPRRPERAPADVQIPSVTAETIRRSCTAVINGGVRLNCDPLNKPAPVSVNFASSKRPDGRYPARLRFPWGSKSCEANTAIGPDDNGRTLNPTFLCK